jgi:SAM-dependent methyltransferase
MSVGHEMLVTGKGGRVETTYDRIGLTYSRGRRTDPRWMAEIQRALKGARTVVDVGAGTGSYEPESTILAVEPSAAMIRQRQANAPPTVRGVAEHLPLRDRVAEVALAVLTVHHWSAWRRGIAELRRISERQVVLAYDKGFHMEFWLVREYIPEVADVERERPSADQIAEEMGADSMSVLPVPWDFEDAVFPAHWRRPEAYLDPLVRRNCSALAQSDPGAVERGLVRLRHDLETGRWQREHADLLVQEEIDAGFRLITR